MQDLTKLSNDKLIDWTMKQSMSMGAYHESQGFIERLTTKNEECHNHSQNTYKNELMRRLSYYDRYLECANTDCDCACHAPIINSDFDSSKFCGG